MSVRALLIAIVTAALVGAAVTAVVGRAREEKRVKQWMLERDSVAEWQELQDTKAAARDRAFADSMTALAASRDTTEQLKRQYATLKASRIPIDPLVLPDTGAIPVAIVKATQEMWQNELAKADEEIVALERINARQEKDLATFDRLLVESKNDFVAERVQRQKWEHLAKTAPVEKKAWKLLGVVPLPNLSVGCGAGVQFTGQPYAGCGAQVGWTIRI